MHRSERADRLVDVLGDVLGAPLPDPMATEVVAVPTRGVERWLAQRLSNRLGSGPAGSADGVCANIEFPFPGALITRATAAACGIDPDADPWPPERSVWPLLEVVDAHLGDRFLGDLAAHLREAAPGGAGLRRFATVRHLADLFDHYGVHRPEMIQRWSVGEEAGDADTGSWQAELWRRLRGRLGVESPAERLGHAAARLADDPSLVGLPSRLSLFGLTRLPASYLAVLDALAVGRDIHLCLLHPSGELWERVVATAPRPARSIRRRDDHTTRLAANPLLRSWGRDAREMQLVIGADRAIAGEYRPVDEETATLLGRVQADVRADRYPPGQPRPGRADARPLLDPDDDSLQIHSCHGRTRQVEVLRDAVLHLLADHPGLEARDVVVMCPDIEVFAPLIRAAFAAGVERDPDHESGDGTARHAGDTAHAGRIPHLRIRLADRSLRQTNPLLGVAEQLLELAGGRMSASELVDFASREPVRRRFGFDQDDLAQIARWVARSGARWGLDAAHRAPWHLESLEANTWSAGLDRLLLGVAMADEDQRLFASTVPLDDVSGTAVALAGRMAELIARLQTAVDTLRTPKPVAQWQAHLRHATEALALAAEADSWQQDQLQRVLDQAAEEAGSQAETVELELSEARSLLANRLRGRPTRANFRTGDVTVCTLVPMRSVPHRVVCLLGLDDGTFPRHTERDGDDLLVADPRVGDREASSEDRQLLLDALLAATGHLIVTYSGRDERTNHPRPPAVPVSELLDVVDRTVRTATGERPRDAVTVHHPLQPFDGRNFAAGALGRSGPWGFDPLHLAGARASNGPRRARRPFMSGLLPPPGGRVVELESLVRFVEHPVKAFLRERLGVYPGSGPDEVEDTLPVQPGALERWALGDRLLSACLAGDRLSDAIATERVRGFLPPGATAEPVLEEVVPGVAALVDVVVELSPNGAQQRSMEVQLLLPDGRLLVGTVPGVRGTTIVSCTYSRLGPKHQIAAWARFAALGAAFPEIEISSVAVGRAGYATSSGHHTCLLSTLRPLGVDAVSRRREALEQLAALVDLYDCGMREPLPLYLKTSGAWAGAVHDGGDPSEAAAIQWDPGYRSPGESEDPAHRLVLGGVVPFTDLLAGLPTGGEAGTGWREGECTRFGRLARRQWDGFLSHEQTEKR
ncbi:MAG: exodeoxyribonuclease V subunit gamma [Acidimicrobiales bacterium]